MSILISILALCCFINLNAAGHSAETITQDLNSNRPPIVTGITPFGEFLVPYVQSPLPKSLWVFQGEKGILEAGSSKKMLCGAMLTSSQVLIIRNNATGKTGMYYLDNFFNGKVIFETMRFFGNDASVLSVLIVINQNYFDIEEKAREFRGTYGRTIDQHLERIIGYFRSIKISPAIVRLRSQNIEQKLRSYLATEENNSRYSQHLSSEIFRQLSLDVPTRIGINARTGEIFWWSLPLCRVYADPKMTRFFDRVCFEKKCALGKRFYENPMMNYALDEMPMAASFAELEERHGTK